MSARAPYSVLTIICCSCSLCAPGIQPGVLWEGSKDITDPWSGAEGLKCCQLSHQPSLQREGLSKGQENLANQQMVRGLVPQGLAAPGDPCWKPGLAQSDGSPPARNSQSISGHRLAKLVKKAYTEVAERGNPQSIPLPLIWCQHQQGMPRAWRRIANQQERTRSGVQGNSSQ